MQITPASTLTAPGAPFELIRTGPAGSGGLEYRHAPRSLREVLIAAGETATDDTYIAYEGRSLSAVEHDARCRQLAAHLYDEVGIRRGDRVAIAMRNLPEFSVVLWALQSIGAVAVPLNAWWSGPEQGHSVRHSGSVALVADGERWDRLQPEVGDTLRAVLLTHADGSEPGAGDAAATLLSTIFAGPAVADYPDVEVGPDDPATIVYTSGTTGSPKGAVHTQRNYCSSLMNNRLNGEIARQEYVARAGNPPAEAASDCILLTYPLFHIAGLINLCLSMGSPRTKLVLMRRWDAVQAGDLIIEEKVTTALLVPTTLRSLLSDSGPRLAATPGIALRTVGAGGASVPGELIDRLGELFDGRVLPVNGYGLTETTAGAISGGGAEYIANPTSVGRPMPSMEVRIVDLDGTEAAPGAAGEIVVRGPSVSIGYWNNPDETARAFTDGWFRTGDLGKVDANGLYYVVDRIKEVIIRGGENVFCPEVEAVLENHPDVLEAAVFAVPDEAYGEAVGAVVRTRAGLTAEALRDYAGGHLAYFKVPTQILVIDHELPRTASGKVLKRELKTLL